jgi:LysM repeat protein
MMQINVFNAILDTNPTNADTPRRTTMFAKPFHSLFHRASLLFLVLAILLSSFFAASPARAATTCASYHTVAYGETLFKIGLKYGLLWTTIAKANNITDGNKIYAGTKLCIPASTTTTPTSTPTTNPTTTPAPTATPKPSVKIPTFSIVEVVKDKSVTIKTANFPKNTDFVVRMGNYGTLGINGEKVTTINSGEGGTLTLTFTIPAGQTGKSKIAIRLESTSGYYSYNWFYNNSTK